jgi:hypothetical protein
MTGSSIPNVVIVVVVIAGDCGGELASPAIKPAEARTRQEHAEDESGQSPDTHPPGASEDDAE